MAEIVTTAQLAERYQVSAETILTWSKAGKIPSIRVGKKVRRYDVTAVMQALDTKVESGCPTQTMTQPTVAAMQALDTKVESGCPSAAFEAQKPAEGKGGVR